MINLDLNSDVTRAVNSIIPLIILVFSGWGLLSILKAFWDVFSERSKLSRIVADEYKDGKHLSIDRAAELIRELEDGITSRRLNVICEMVAKKGGKNAITPQITDLHQLSEQDISSCVAPTSLRIITSTLLICGICGTLWGVHEVIQTGGMTDMKRFAPALVPSMLAVAATILFFLLRGLFVATVDRFLWRLDRETMTRFLPDLLPGSDLNVQISQLAKSISDFNSTVGGSLDGIRTAVDAAENAAKAISKTAGDLSQTGSKLDQLADQSFRICSTIKVDQEELAGNLQKARDGIDNLDSGIQRLQELNTAISSGIQIFHAGVGSLRSSIETGSQELGVSTRQAGDLAKQACQLSQDIAVLDLINNKAESLKTDIQNAAGREQSIFDSFSISVSKTAGDFSGAQKGLANLVTYTQSLENLVSMVLAAGQNAEANAQSIQTQAENLQNDIQSHKEIINTATRQVQSEQNRLINLTGDVSEELHTLIEGARKSTGGFWHRILFWFKKTFRK